MSPPAVGLLSFGDYYEGRRVLVTGDTGFKGTWLCAWLDALGSEVHGLGLPPEGEWPMFDTIRAGSFVQHADVDVRDAGATMRTVAEMEPEVVFHLAAQSLVRRSYERPLDTLATNVLGTAHVLAAVSSLVEKQGGACSVVVVTSDKSYRNLETDHAYEEHDALGGKDPYSASKAAQDIVASAWQQSFGAQPSHGADHGVLVSTCRAGNVIGGGDWAEDRIVPDCIRALVGGTPILVRHPEAVRPWQHVLEPLSGYLLVGSQMPSSVETVGAWNFGPGREGERTVAELCDRVVASWGEGNWVATSDAEALHEAGTLRLAIDRAGDMLGWRPTWSFDQAVDMTVEWYMSFASGASPESLAQLTRAQIESYVDDAHRLRA